MLIHNIHPFGQMKLDGLFKELEIAYQVSSFPESIGAGKYQITCSSHVLVFAKTACHK